MNKNKISVIVPVYNTEKYLDKCIESLLRQTYENIELIIVEDCSTDNSKELLKKYEGNKKIKIIYNKENMGLSYSRNVGLEKSTGDFIGYIDSDDYVQDNYYELLMKSILVNKSEIAICDMNIVYENDDNKNVVSKCCNFDKFSKLNIINNGLVASACNKLFKKELISKYKFDVGKVNEDLAVIIPTIINANKISYAKDCYYNYVQRNNSIQNSSFSMKRFDIFYGVDKTIERIKGCKDFDKIKDAIIYNQIIVLLIYVIPKEKNLKKRRFILKKFNELSLKYNIRKNIYFWKFLENCGFKHKIYYKIIFKLNCNRLYFLSNLMILFYDILISFYRRSVIKNNISIEDLVSCAKKQSKMRSNITISAVIPNYNYDEFLYERLYSILYQTEKINEIIILDDCSTDDSRKSIDLIVEKLSKYVNITKEYNKKNSGSPFIQWGKGLNISKSDYVWIAEADDYCDKNLLKNLVKPIKKNNNIIISYADTAFIDKDGNIILKSIKSEIDIQKTGHWNRNYVNNGLSEIKDYTYLNCTIANVSSCIIKNTKYNKLIEKSFDYRQAGDWLFYANLMQYGDVAYCSKPLNYYRVHGNNISSTMKAEKHLKEINKIHEYFIDIFKLDNKHKSKMGERVKFLKKFWLQKEGR